MLTGLSSFKSEARTYTLGSIEVRAYSPFLMLYTTVLKYARTLSYKWLMRYGGKTRASLLCQNNLMLVVTFYCRNSMMMVESVDPVGH